ncbi:Release factor glutamine methyltransferase [Methylobacterium crusticola]|uniref:Release factor glutamine methyltransferase n=1 Tax=Methylobacterium crusticola TaxID=1697972 RepID=A0ABQ4QRH8_9HYPH|nr:peptide chain release factor N(5)-glutamine methyltransferase [Methylobacterium crusticola]GJD47666.1 Release factor glutamine methyltransferase [Methylobacterium crusticola]
MTASPGPVDGATTRAEARARAAAILARHGIGTAALDARLLLEECLGLRPTDLVLGAERPIGAEGARRLAQGLARRCAGEPVARIAGAWEFWGLPFRLCPATLVPRPDTETLVEAALALARPGPLRLLDLGTGSGCLLVALLSEWPRATGLGIDRSPAALATARANAARNGVAARAAFAAGDWGAALAGGRYDVVVANPPYIATARIDDLAEEVRAHDPHLALDGGPDGLAAYRVILAQAAGGPDGPGLLAPEGRLLVEIGYDQEDALRALAPAAGLRVEAVRRDLAGHPRVVAMARAEAG